MFKKIIFLFLSIFIGLSLYYLFIVKRDSEQTNLPATIIENPSMEDEQENYMISRIYRLSQKGKVVDVTAISGESRFDEVTKLYGDPESIDETASGSYAVYSNHQLTIGYQDSIAFDLRSYTNEIKQIKYLEIFELLGEPSNVKYYKDTEVNQIILIYDVNANYQLKWILNKPNESHPNPTVHHISVVAKNFSKQAQNDIALTIAEKIEGMTIDEKIGQMIFAGVSGVEPNTETEQLLHKYKVGGIIFNKKNMTNPSQTLAYVNYLKVNNSENKVPLFLGIDQEGGRVSKLPGELLDTPTNSEIGMTNDPSLSYQLGSVFGKLVRTYGFNMNFAPVLDVNSNPDNPVIGDRSFGGSPNLVSEFGMEMMKGIQSEKIVSVIKHFPGHGDTSVDSHLELPVVNKSISELEKLELIPFRHAVNNGADMVMIAHLLLPKIDSNFPSSLSKVIITDLLRNEIGFNGVIITDDMTMEAITGNFEIGEAAVTSVKAGSDIIMVAHNYEKILEVISGLKKAIEDGGIQEERINESVTRILTLKEKYGITDSWSEKVNINELNQLIKSILEERGIPF